MTYQFQALAVLGAALSLAACGPGAESEVSFAQQVKPILDRSCVECHSSGGEGLERSGLALTGYDALMEGTRYGPVVQPGSAVSSTLYLVVAGKTDASIQMPHGQAVLASDEVELIRRWIDQGALDN